MKLSLRRRMSSARHRTLIILGVIIGSCGLFLGAASTASAYTTSDLGPRTLFCSASNSSSSIKEIQWSWDFKVDTGPNESLPPYDPTISQADINTALNFAIAKCEVGNSAYFVKPGICAYEGQTPYTPAVPEPYHNYNTVTVGCYIVLDATAGTTFPPMNPGDSATQTTGTPAASTSPTPPPGASPGSCGLVNLSAMEYNGTLSYTVTQSGSAFGCNNMILDVECDNGGPPIVSGHDETGMLGQSATVVVQVPTGATACTATATAAGPKDASNTPTYGGNWQQQYRPGGGFSTVKHHSSSNPVTSNVALPPPLNVHVNAAGLVSWQKDSAAYHAVKRDNQTIALVPGSGTSFQDTPAADGKAHTYSVAAQGSWYPSTEAPWSEVTQPPLNVKYGFDSVIWDGVVGDSDVHYSVLIDGHSGPAWCTNGVSTGCDLSGQLANDTQHTATVAATDPQGNPISDQGTSVSFTYLSPPTGARADGVCGYNELSWNPVPGATAYKVYNGFTYVGNGDAIYDTYTLPSQLSGHYYVTAVSADGSESAYSAGVSTLSSTSC